MGERIEMLKKELLATQLENSQLHEKLVEMRSQDNTMATTTVDPTDLENTELQQKVVSLCNQLEAWVKY